MRLPLGTTALALAAALAAAGAAQAANLSLAVNHSVRLALPGPAASVVVGNPDVADVTVVDSHTVFVSGRGTGSTDVAVLDPIGRTLFSGDVHVTGQPGARVLVHRGVAAGALMACDPACVDATGGSAMSKPSTPTLTGLTASFSSGATAAPNDRVVAGPAAAIGAHAGGVSASPL